MTRAPWVLHLMIVARVAAQGTDGAGAAGAAGATGDPVSIAKAEVARGLGPRTVDAGDAVVYPYGAREAEVVCAPLRACVIELESEERVLATALGDTERWLVERAGTGVGGRTPLVIVKPVACGLATNLVVSTDRRVYDIALDAPRCGRGVAGAAGAAGGASGGGTAGAAGAAAAARYTPHVRFYYPTGMVARAGEVSAAAVRPESLAFTYRWVADRKVAWSPAAVYDDGAHVYVRLGAEARHGELPVLFAELPDKTTALMNYVVSNDTYITDRVFERAVLVGAGGARRIEIVNVVNTPAR
jgi:type IV secretion system protein TrbG